MASIEKSLRLHAHGRVVEASGVGWTLDSHEAFLAPLEINREFWFDVVEVILRIGCKLPEIGALGASS